MTAHRDFLGRTLNVGDRVVMMTTEWGRLQLAQIIEMTPNKVRVAWDHHEWTTYAGYPESFVKVEGPDLTWYLLINDSK